MGYYAHEAYDEEWSPVVDAAQHSDMATVAKLVVDGDIYQKIDLDLRANEIEALRPMLRARSLALFDEGSWWMFSAVRECPTCGADVLKTEQCETCIGPKPAVVS